MKKIHNLYAIFIAIVIFILDRLTKVLIENTISLGQSIQVIPNIFHFTLVHNLGAGFGILKNQKWFFIIFSIVVLIGIIYKWKKIPKNFHTYIPLGLIIGGILGNLYDRVLFSYVIDFIDFRIWPVFNIADSALTIAAIWLVIYYWKK